MLSNPPTGKLFGEITCASLAMIFSLIIPGCASIQSKDAAPVILANTPQPVATSKQTPIPTDLKKTDKLSPPADAAPGAQLTAPLQPEVKPPADSVYFKSGSHVISAPGKKLIAKHAERLRSNARMEVTLIGHTDDLGSRSYNIAIGNSRTDAVEHALLAEGVQQRQIRKTSVGQEKDRGVLCRSEACRSLSRRVDFIYDE